MSADLTTRSQNEAVSKKQTAKLTQVLINFFTKAAQVILDSRANSESQSFNETPFDANTDHQNHRINKWFNLHMLSSYGATKEDLKLWKSADVGTIPPMIIETYLDLRQLPANQTLVLLDDQKHPWTVASANGKKQEVVLERWLIEFDQKMSSQATDELPLIYKQAIILFRTLYGYSRLMPAYKLKKKNMNKLSLGNKILDGSQPISSKGRIGLSKSIINQPDSPHTTQKNFTPISTSMGALRISIAYRNHYDFCLHEHEEVLSAQFGKRDEDTRKLMSLSPSSSLSSSKDQSPLSIKEQSLSPEKGLKREPYRVGSREISPTPGPISAGTQVGQPSMVQNIPSSLERKVSITSNKSISNASLAAFLRNPRSSTPSTNAVPITGGNSNHPYGSSIPKSVSSSTGHDDVLFSQPDSSNNTPRFSSSFGSRASRRFSNTSIRQQTPLSDYFAHGNSVDAALSGLYVDDDINDFVRMIDSKSDLKLGRSSTDDSIKTRPVIESADSSDAAVLRRYQLLKGKHQQLSDSVNASVILQSRQSSRKSSLNSPPGSFDQSQLIVSSLQSKLREASPRATSIEPNRPLITSRINSSSLAPSATTSPPKAIISNIDASNQQPQATRLSSVDSVPLNDSSSSSTTANRANVLPSIKSKPTTTVVTGMATSPSIYDYRSSFKIDDLSINEDTTQKRKLSRKDDCEDEDDLLFTMSDMNSK